MEYVQERVTTLHDFDAPAPEVPLERTAVVVPMTEREYASLAAERVFETLADLQPATIFVALRAPPSLVAEIRDWFGEFDLPLTLLWCNGPGVESLLYQADLDGELGKGRDVWLALGRAAEAASFVAVHDADAKSYGPSHVRRLVWPLTSGYSFSKGYYARVENRRLYGRLFRLFYAPLVRTLADRSSDPILSYLESFRYALAGEFAVTASLAGKLSVPRQWGLEVATLGDTFEHAGFAGTAQVDLGRHEHDHRSVGGPTGLADMSKQVGEALLSVVERHGVTPEYESLATRYRETAEQFVRQYEADAAFNGLEYDRGSELQQVATYAESIEHPDGPRELPAWDDAPLSPADIQQASREDLDGL